MNEDHRRLSGAFAVDAVTEDERAAHEAAMREDLEVAEETRSLMAAVAELSKTSDRPPPHTLREQVLRAVRTVRPLPPLASHSPTGSADPLGPTEAGEDPNAAPAPVDLQRHRARRRLTWLSTLAAAAAAVVAVVVVVVGQRDVGPVNQAQTVISASDVSSQVATVDDWSATLYLSQAEDKAVIASEQMPDAPVGSDFQVWLEHEDGSLTSAGVMPRTNGGGQEYVVNGVQDEVVAIAVSVEPAGGSVQPTAEPVLVIDVA